MKLKHFSNGMRARLAFSSSLYTDSDVLLIDEVLSVGDIKFRQKSYQAFLELKKNSKTILHVTHNLDKLTEYSDRVILLDKGKLISIGKPVEVIALYKKLHSSKN